MGLKTLSGRNYGLDILKCLSMLGVVILHCLSAGGILENVSPLSTNFNVAWLLEIICLHSVNIFAIITGYVSIKSKRVWIRLADLWFSVIFYSILLGGAFFLLGNAGLSEFIFTSFPVINGTHWYFCAYIVIWLFMPYINKLIQSLSKKQHLTLILVSLVLFSGINFIGEIFDKSPFVLKGGYSPTWLLTLYFIGSYLRLYAESFNKIKKIPCLLTFFGCSLLSWIVNFVLTFIGGDIAARLTATLRTYPSPLMVLGAISMVLFFSKLDVKHCKKLIVTLSASSFFVYIIHTNPFFWSLIIDRLKFTVSEPWYVLVFAVFALAIIIYTVCMVTDIIRQKIFKLFHINKLYEFVVKILFTCFNRLREILLNKI